MSTINVISPPNASDAEAASYTFNVVPYSSDSTDLSRTIIFNDGVLKITGLSGDSIYSYYAEGPRGQTILTLGGRGGTQFEATFLDQSPDQGIGRAGYLQASRLGDAVYITEGSLHQPAGATLIQGYSVAPTPAPQAPSSHNVTIHDTTTNADLPDTSSAYTGPVAGIATQYTSITPDSLSIAALSDSMFVKTGSGDDAVALHGGTNVVDAGGGSNFLTGASGFDTYFLDTRNIAATTSAAGSVPGSIWDTIEDFGSGDAVTLWGIGTGAALNWQKDQGAAGHAGLTLHANKANGSEASVTFAGIDNRLHLSMSYGSSGGASYLYLKAT